MKRLLSLTTVALFFAYGPLAGAIGKERLRLARSKTSKAEKLIKQSEFVGAEKLFRTAISTEPLLPTAYLGLGKALVGQQRYAEALESLAEAEKRFVEWEQAVQIADLKKRQLAERQLQSIRDVQAAVSDKSSVLSGGAPTAGAPAPGQLTAAKIEAEQFLFRDHRQMEGFNAIPAQVFYLEGISYLRTNRRALGIKALEVCLLINPKHELAHYNLAVALFTRGDFEEAKPHLDKAIEEGAEPHQAFVADLELALASRQIAQGSDQPPG